MVNSVAYIVFKFEFFSSYEHFLHKHAGEKQNKLILIV